MVDFETNGYGLALSRREAGLPTVGGKTLKQS